MKYLCKEKILQIVADAIIVANLMYQMFFASEPASFDRFNCAFAGAVTGAYLMYRVKNYRCWRQS